MTTLTALSLDELELVVVSLAEHTIACRQSAVAKRRLNDHEGADNDLRELMRTGVLQNRLALELTDKLAAAKPKAQPFALGDQCDECGSMPGQPHATDCERVRARDEYDPEVDPPAAR